MATNIRRSLGEATRTRSGQRIPTNPNFITIPQLARRAGLTKAQVKALFDVMTAVLGEGTSIRVIGFGRIESIYFPPAPWKSGLGEGISSAKIVVKFAMSEALLEKWQQRLVARDPSAAGSNTINPVGFYKQKLEREEAEEDDE